MEAHCIKVAIDKEFFTNELLHEEKPSLKDITSLFEGKKVKFITTFTNQTEHYRILSSVTKSLSIEEQFLQIKLRNISNGYEIIERIMNERVTQENIELLPDIIFSNDEKLQKTSGRLGVLCLSQTFFTQDDKTRLCIMKISDFFKLTPQLPFWRIRIEDRYLIKNISSERDAESLFDSLNINTKHCFIEIIYSNNDYDYKGSSYNDYVDASERMRRIEILKKIGKSHVFKFYPKAGHDRYFCTNSSLFIVGNSITSDKETHITYYPLIQYYNEYFKMQ